MGVQNVDARAWRVAAMSSEREEKDRPSNDTRRKRHMQKARVTDRP